MTQRQQDRCVQEALALSSLDAEAPDEGTVQLARLYISGKLTAQ